MKKKSVYRKWGSDLAGRQLGDQNNPTLQGLILHQKQEVDWQAALKNVSLVICLRNLFAHNTLGKRLKIPLRESLNQGGAPGVFLISQAENRTAGKI